MNRSTTAIRRMVDAALRATPTCMLAEVRAYSSSPPRADLDPVQVDDAGERLPPLLNVPVVWPGSSEFIVHAPLSVGDVCMVMILDRDNDAFLATGDADTTRESKRARNLTDAIAVPLVMTDGEDNDATSGRMYVGTRDGSASLSITTGGRVTVESGDIRLGSDSATDPLVLLSDMRSYLTSLVAALATGANSGGAVVWSTPIPSPSTLNGAGKVSGE